MQGRIALPHLALLLISTAAAIWLNWSAISASSTLYNLIIVIPAGLLVLALVVGIALSQWRSPAEPKQGERENTGTALGDLALIALFALLCFGMTRFGFDIATFLFIWVGVIACGERNLWRPPLFAAVMTLVLVKGLGQLFPYPLTLTVL